MTKDKPVDSLSDGGLVFHCFPLYCLEECLHFDYENVAFRALYHDIA